MWCPHCDREYPDATEVCPVCGELLQGPPVLLMGFTEERALAEATELLSEAGIPYLCREEEQEIGLYVPEGYTHRALRLLRQFDRDAQAPFDEEQLNAAIAAYREENPEEFEKPGDDEIASPEGYRMVWFFVVIFVVLALIPLIRSLFVLW